MTSHQLPPPQLLPELRLALACLYNLPIPHHHQQQPPTLSQAQEFLIYLQSRNVKRRLESMVQRQRDKANSTAASNNSNVVNGEKIRTGSSWLASLALLSQRGSHSGFAASSTERIFAAQTLLHRLIRSKLDQAIDWEIEVAIQDSDAISTVLFQQLQNPLPLPQVVQHYQQILHQYHPFVGAVVARYQIQQNCEEDRVKGELSILTLVAIVYTTALDCFADNSNNNNQDHNAGPLLNALGAATAAIALRLRFPPITRGQQQQQPQQQSSQPLVAIITQSLSLVFQTAAEQNTLHLPASSEAIRACLSAIPDICLGSTGGGARGRMSIDPKCLQEAGKELKTTGFVLLWDVLRQHVQDMQQHQELLCHRTVLIICERWARFLPLPQEFLEHTIPLARNYLSSTHPDIRTVAFGYLCAIYESASLTTDQILAKSLGLAPDQQAQQQQSGKKRQTSKSKKRQQEAVENRTTDTMLDEARAEFHHRGYIACQATVMVWEQFQSTFQNALAEASRMPAISAQGDEIQIEGEGPIGCLAACANACLAHLLRTSSTPALAFPQSTELFVAIAHAFQEICQSPHRVIRAFAMEPIFSLHKTLVQHALECEEGIHPPLDPGLQDAVVELFVRCAMSLAIACGYSADYFQDFGAMSDEDLEIERNDVRDVIRTVAVSERGGSTAFADVTRPPLEVTLKVLARLLHACFESIDASRKASQLFHETAVHCYSALAKSLNQLSKFYAKTGQPSVAPEILRLALQIMTTSLQIVIEGFSSSSLEDLFPVSRIANLAIAALSPMMSNLCTIPRFEEDVKAALRLSLSVAAMSVAQIPELATSSELGNATYDIRGAARGPGGEDHVGCLAIMRLTFESEQLAGKLIEAAGADISQLGQLHSQLKSIEVKRGKGVVHGQGSTPTSRRILLGVICHLEIVSKGSAGCSSMLTEIFHNAFSSIASFANSEQSYLDDDKVIFQICESTWDLAAFSPVIVESLFASEGELATTKLDCLRVLTKCICRGYERPSIYDEGTQPAAVIMVAMEWNRLRAGFFALLKTSISAKMPQTLFESVEAIIRSECEAAQVQCQAGPSSGSSIFNDEVVSAEHIPAGLFVRIIQEMIESLQEKPNNETALGSCVTTLERVKPYVLGAVTHPCQDPQCFADPRPALFEAWFLVMATLSNKAATLQVGSEATLRNLLVDSCVAAISLLFSPFLSKTRDLRSQSPCLSFEGPQTLALMEFLCSYFALGPAMLQPVCHELIRRFPIDSAKANQFTTDVQCHSVAIIGAALYRVAQGALPPWSVESIHEVYAALFLALNLDVNAFGSMLHLGMEIRLAPGANRGSVKSEELLSGPLFEGVKETAKQRFVHESVELCKQDNNGAWKRMKVLLKKFCGGKKIGTDFAQKSSPTNWLFERV